jgi:hypothetical protein
VSIIGAPTRRSRPLKTKRTRPPTSDCASHPTMHPRPGTARGLCIATIRDSAVIRRALQVYVALHDFSLRGASVSWAENDAFEVPLGRAELCGECSLEEYSESTEAGANTRASNCSYPTLPAKVLVG